MVRTVPIKKYDRKNSSRIQVRIPDELLAEITKTA